MTEEKAKPKKATSKKAVALKKTCKTFCGHVQRYENFKSLCTDKGMVKKGEEFTCSAKEYEIFKKAKAV